MRSLTSPSIHPHLSTTKTTTLHVLLHVWFHVASVCHVAPLQAFRLNCRIPCRLEWIYSCTCPLKIFAQVESRTIVAGHAAVDRRRRHPREVAIFRLSIYPPHWHEQRSSNHAFSPRGLVPNSPPPQVGDLVYFFSDKNKSDLLVTAKLAFPPRVVFVSVRP